MLLAAPGSPRLHLPAVAGSLALHLVLAIGLGGWALHVMAPVSPPLVSFAVLPALPSAPAPELAPLELEQPLLAREAPPSATHEATTEAPAPRAITRQPSATPRPPRPKQAAAPAAVPPVAAPAAATAATATKAATVTPPLFDVGYLRNPPPDYPATARRRRLTGEVILSVQVTAAGLPQAVAVATSSGHAMLDAAALEAVRQWRFVPAQSGGTPTAAAVLVPISFKLRQD